LINTIIIPNLGKEAEKRLLVAINQADMAMKGKDRWDYDNNKPTPKAEKFLEEKVQSVKTRIKEATGVNIEPIYYCAGYKEEGEEQRPYNLSKLMYLIVKHIPSKKRLLIADNISKDQEMWKDSDELKDYATEIRSSFFEAIKDGMEVVGEIGRELGEKIGMGLAGETVGKVVGAVGGAVTYVFESIEDFFSSLF
jgi:predicted GTPase